MKESMKQETKRYEIRILMQCGTTQHWLTEEIEAESFHTSERGYFYFLVQGKGKYYPINNTIVKEL
jgi:hypothetical protein